MSDGQDKIISKKNIGKAVTENSLSRKGNSCPSPSALPLFFYTMKDAYYFPHDSNAQEDEKMLRLRHKYGYEGIGLYWCIIERLRNNKDYKYSSLAKAGLALGLNHPCDRLEAFLNDCFEIGLLTENDGFFYSESLIRRMEKVDEMRDKLRLAGRKGGLSSAQARLKLPSSIKVKESKVKESNIQPSLRKVVDHYFALKNYGLDSQWGKQNYGRYAKVAKRLLALTDQNPEVVLKVVEKGKSYFAGKKLDWTLETIEKHWNEIKKYQNIRYD